MTDVMAGTINKVADKLGRKWSWNQQSTQVEGDTVFEQCSSLICVPPQQDGSNDCGTAVNELGRRLMFNESVTDFPLTVDGNKLRARQASEILECILSEGLP